MESKHTPGPWWAYQNTAGRWGVATYRDNEDPATSPFIGSSTGASITLSIGDHTEARTSGNEEANARLIAAAPEMFEMLCQVAEGHALHSDIADLLLRLEGNAT